MANWEYRQHDLDQLPNSVVADLPIVSSLQYATAQAIRHCTSDTPHWCSHATVRCKRYARDDTPLCYYPPPCAHHTSAQHRDRPTGFAIYEASASAAAAAAASRQPAAGSRQRSSAIGAMIAVGDRGARRPRPPLAAGPWLDAPCPMSFQVVEPSELR